MSRRAQPADSPGPSNPGLSPPSGGAAVGTSHHELGRPGHGRARRGTPGELGILEAALESVDSELKKISDERSRLTQARCVWRRSIHRSKHPWSRRYRFDTHRPCLPCAQGARNRSRGAVLGARRPARCCALRDVLPGARQVRRPPRRHDRRALGAARRACP